MQKPSHVKTKSGEKLNKWKENLPLYYGNGNGHGNGNGITEAATLPAQSLSKVPIIARHQFSQNAMNKHTHRIATNIRQTTDIHRVGGAEILCKKRLNRPLPGC